MPKVNSIQPKYEQNDNNTTGTKVADDDSSSIFPNIPVAKQENTGIIHRIVITGETLTSIAQEFDIPIEDLKTYNPNLADIPNNSDLNSLNIQDIKIITTKQALIEEFGFDETFLDNLIDIERKKHKKYTDSGGNVTIGIGHNATAHQDSEYYKHKFLSNEQIYSLFARDWTKAQNIVKAALQSDDKTNVYDKLSKNQKLAICDIAFNLGKENFNKCVNLIATIKVENYINAIKEMDEIYGKNSQGKTVVQAGLIKRRLFDISNFIKDIKMTNKEENEIKKITQNLYELGHKNINVFQRIKYNIDVNKYFEDFIETHLF